MALCYIYELDHFCNFIFRTTFFSILEKSDIQAAIFLGGMFFIGLSIVLYSIHTKPKRIDLILLIGIATVYLLLYLRLGLPERSHLIEYSVLSLCIHQILIERIRRGKLIQYPAFIALGITFVIGLLDELSQLFIPDRVFDINDILFNGIVILMAIGMHSIVQFLKKDR